MCILAPLSVNVTHINTCVLEGDECGLDDWMVHDFAKCFLGFLVCGMDLFRMGQREYIVSSISKPQL